MGIIITDNKLKYCNFKNHGVDKNNYYYKNIFKEIIQGKCYLDTKWAVIYSQGISYGQGICWTDITRNCRGEANNNYTNYEER